MKSNFDYNLYEKEVRAKVIKEHLNQLGKNICVCFTCGNATKALRQAGLEVISVGESEEFTPNKWFSYTEIQKSFNGLFDATSGHLPLPLMNEIALKLKSELRYHFKPNKSYEIKVGSGETISCLKMAFPYISFNPIRLKAHKPTTFNKEAPGNSLIYALFGTYGDIKKDEKEVFKNGKIN